MGVVMESRDPLFGILGPLHISETAEARNSKFGMQIDPEQYYQENAKLGQIGVVWGSCDLLLEFWDPLYLGNGWSLKVVISQADWPRGGLSKTAKLSQRGHEGVTLEGVTRRGPHSAHPAPP